MFLLIGLGNPEKKYFQTRHNLGFRVIDKLRERYQFPEFNRQEKFRALVSQGRIKNQKIILVKPQTYMNRSGESVKKITDFFRLPLENLWVVHDDIDLPLGRLRISFNLGSAGHRGIESIIQSLDSQAFVRFRLGIRNFSEENKPDINKFVLDKFSKEEKKIVREMIEKTIKAIEVGIGEGIWKAMNEFN